MIGEPMSPDITAALTALEAERQRTDRWLRALIVTSSVLLGLVLTICAWAIDGIPYAEETITVSSSAVGLTAGLCTQSGVVNPALVQVKTNAIYFTLHSATATPDSGDYEAAAGTYLEVQRPDRLRMIRQTSDAAVKVTCFQR
jgi:hypothetical protein